MQVETDDNIFIIEFKCNQNAEQALRQIKEKNYSEGFELKDKGLVLMGINFDTDKKNIDEYVIE